MNLSTRQPVGRAAARATGPRPIIPRRTAVEAHCLSKGPVEQAPAADSRGAAPARRSLLLGAAAAAAALALSGGGARPAAAADAYLLSTGAKGFLAEEEAKLLQLRRELEGEVRRELEAERRALEEAASRTSAGKLCATPFGIDIVGITEFVALVGALVGGITARQRKAELERLNEQLRKVNMGLRQQARAGMVYAPGLTYVPPTVPASPSGADGGPLAAAAAVTVQAPPAPAAVTVQAPPRPPAAALQSAAAAAPAAERTLLSLDDDEMSPDQLQCRDALRAGKRLLKEKNGAAAMVRFEKALMLSKSLGDKVQERRAMRGLAAAARLQGQYRAAIRHLERVLEISRELREFTGDADAYGTIADCYTEMDDFENAAINYDKYIKVMSTDGPV